MARVVVDLNDGRGPQPAEDALSHGPNDLSYFVRVAEVAATLSDGFDRFLVSYSPAVSDQLTGRDVWVFVGDETATPVPNGICPVLRTYGERFIAPDRDLMKEPLLAVAEQVQVARNGARGLWRNRGRRRSGPGHHAPGWLPLGTPAFATAPRDVPPIGDRPIDVGFRGSIGGGRPYAPKTISRRRMAAAISRLPSDLVVDFVELESFAAAYAQHPADYVRSLLDTKVCLAPRGGSTETFRVFEAALAGCVIVTEPLPPAWFYAGLSRIELRSWSELPGALEQLRSHPAQLEVMSRNSRDWATDVVSPEAVGQWAARWLKDQTR